MKLKSKESKYLFRLALLLILQSLIKGFDHSFKGIFDFSFRSVSFFFSFILYWMVIWALFSLIIDETEKRLSRRIRPVSLYINLSILILLLSVAAAILFNLFYRWFDVYLFGMKEMWLQTPFPHPDLIYPLILLSLLIFLIDRFIYFADQLKNAELYASHLEQVAVQSKYEALKNQVDPHFFFNSLSVLSSIVHTDPDLSAQYIYNLSKLYRYSLESGKPDVVSLKEELESLDSYIFLITIRYPENLGFRIRLDRSKGEKTGIHHSSLQLLVENAIKHNIFRDEEPLIIEVFEEDGYIVVRNQLRKRKQLTPSTGIGLENIRRRYELHDNKRILVEDKDGYFTVKLPKIEIKTDEDYNR